MKEGIWGVVIVAVIAAYCVFVIRKKIRDVKAGKFCGCGCSQCGKNCAGMKRKE